MILVWSEKKKSLFCVMCIIWYDGDDMGGASSSRSARKPFNQGTTASAADKKEAIRHALLSATVVMPLGQETS